MLNSEIGRSRKRPHQRKGNHGVLEQDVTTDYGAEKWSTVCRQAMPQKYIHQGNADLDQLRQLEVSRADAGRNKGTY